MVKRLTARVGLWVLLLISATSYANMPAHVNGQNVPSLAPMIANVQNAIVNVLASGRSTDMSDSLLDENEQAEEGSEPPPAQRQRKHKGFESLGSGVIVDAKNGYIITNFHLIEQTKAVTVTLSDGRRFKAKIVGTDPASDIAILQIKAEKLTQISIGDSSKLKVGDFVVAIGNPYGLSQTVTSGIISALERNDLGIEGYEDFIQTDAPINPGNSGGALVSLKGELIGINTAILAPHGGNVGIGFAIPSNMALAIMQQIIKFGNVARGMVGIMIQSLTPELAKALNEPGAKGALVTIISPNSPAAKAGILPGDIIQRINNKKIESAGQVQNRIALYRSGSKLEIQVLRDNTKLTFKLVSADPEAYKHQEEAKDPFLNGIILKNFDAIIPGFGHLRGVQALQVTENSPAFQAGIRPGDIIMSINNRPSVTIDDLNTLTEKADKEILVYVFRGNGAIYLVINKLS